MKKKKKRQTELRIIIKPFVGLGGFKRLSVPTGGGHAKDTATATAAAAAAHIEGWHRGGRHAGVDVHRR
jgi:hypothetical protein